MEWMINLPTGDMLRQWKVVHGYESLIPDDCNCDCSIESADQSELDRMLLREIDAWYVKHLMTLPVEQLPLTDIAAKVSLSRSADGVGRVTLPDSALRVVSVEVEGWKEPAIIVRDPSSPLALAQHNRFSRAGVNNPVVVLGHDRRLRLYSIPDEDARLTTLLVAQLPVDGVYSLTQPMFSQVFPCL